MDDIYKVALSFITGFGNVSIRKAIAYTGGLKNFFDAKQSELLKIPGIGHSYVNKLDRDAALKMAAKKLKYITDNDIKICFYLDKDFPQRLLNCIDSPFTLYYKGNVDFNAQRMLSVVGTRNAY